tara:strand:+ start:981 stop:1331 length:351 start_codon:yes stop_codon:yes gene_type:complete
MKEETLEERNEYLERRRGHKLEDLNDILKCNKSDSVYGIESKTFLTALEVLLYHSRLIGDKKQSLAYVKAYEYHIKDILKDKADDREPDTADLAWYGREHKHKIKGLRVDINKWCK